MSLRPTFDSLILFLIWVSFFSTLNLTISVCLQYRTFLSFQFFDLFIFWDSHLFYRLICLLVLIIWIYFSRNSHSLISPPPSICWLDHPEITGPSPHYFAPFHKRLLLFISISPWFNSQHPIKNIFRTLLVIVWQLSTTRGSLRISQTYTTIK